MRIQDRISVLRRVCVWGTFSAQSSEHFIKQVTTFSDFTHFSNANALDFYSVSTLCSKTRVKLFSNWLLLRTQCYGTGIWKSDLFSCSSPYTYLLCNDLISHHSLPYTQQPCYSSFSRHAPIWKHSYLFTVLPGTSFPQIFSWLVPLETLGLNQKPCLKLQTLLDNSHTSFVLSFFHSIYTIKLFSFLFYLATS